MPLKMSDPFADLLSSFRSGGSASVSKEATPEVKQEKLPGRNQINVHDDLDELFGLKKRDETVVKNQVVGDSFDAAFEAFDRPQKVQKSLEESPEMVVDEVKDMEVAKLMSLNLDIDQATDYYERGVLYEQLSRQRREQELIRRREQMLRQQQQQQTPEEKFDSGSFFSLASGILEKGRQFVDQFSGFPQEQDRLTRVRVEQDLPVERPKSVEPPTVEVEEGNLLGEFQEKINLEEPKRSPTPPPQATLLDFDNGTPPERIKTITPVPISHLEISGYKEYKDRGTEFFKAGDYVSASQEYEKSLNSLPQNHALRIVAYSNLTAALFKVGEYKRCLSDIESALEMFPKDPNLWDEPIQDSQPIRTFKEMWPKIVTRRAEAFEHIENYEKALQDYQSLIEKNNFNDKIMGGKRRCQKVLNPPEPKATSPNRSPTPVPKVSEDTKQPKTYANVERVKQENQRNELQEAEKAALYDTVFQQIESWKAGKGDDIRHLLANLSTVLTWCDWKPVSTSDLVMPKKVKITYMKAVAKTHPDKIPSSLELEKRMIAEDVFSSLSVAWEKFKLANDIN